MKLKNIIPFVFATFILCLNSCYDEKMEWNDPYTHPTTAQLPLSLQEKISRYKEINSYANFKIGVGIDFNLYMNDETYQNLVNQNFKDITPGNELKQQSLMNAKGELNFNNTDAVIAKLKAAGLTVYGHTLVWHQQQQASYLNSLIAPTVIPGTPGSSLIDGSFEKGMAGWAATYYKENYTIVNTSAIDGTQSLQVVIPTDATGGKYDGHGQLNSPSFEIINGHHYQISFWIKGSAPGQVAIDFPNGELGNQYPWVNGTEYAPVTTSWKQVVYNTTTVGGTAMIATKDDPAMHVRLLLASVPNVTYLIDAIEVIDLDAATELNYVTDGDFEKGVLPDGWSANNSGAGISVTNEDKFSGNYSVKMISSATSSSAWDLQLASASIVLEPSKTYTFSFYVKSNVAGKGRVSFPGGVNGGNQYPWMNWTGSGTSEAFTTLPSAWTLISVDLTNTSTIKLNFDMGYLPNVTYYLDDVKIVEKTAVQSSMALRAGPVTIDKTPEEKALILNAALVDYIDKVVKHYKGTISAWEVVNEPMNDNGTLRTGAEDLAATNIFHWVYYLGKNYAVTAFKTARAADPDAKLFINDFGLESASGNKLDGLIEYVKYIDANGGHVDGIGTQLHLNLNWSDTIAIANMFTKLAATGKLIKVTELDVAISSESNAGTGPSSPLVPTLDQLEKQAKLYEFVARAYTKIIPAAQQYCIAVWGVSDDVKQHQYWLPNDTPYLWDGNYARKWAYKGFCDGLAGKDVSAGFSGELQY